MFSEPENSQTDAEDIIATLGTIYGVSEIRQSKEGMVGTPVLVAENAFVFFAWQEGEV